MALVRRIPPVSSTLSIGMAVASAFLSNGPRAFAYPSNIPASLRTDVLTPTDYGMAYERVELTTTDKVKIIGYLMLRPTTLVESQEAATPTILFFHGNGGNFGERLSFAKRFYSDMRCNVFMLSYRGYGPSEGRPSEKGIRMDADMALSYIQTHPILKGTKIIIYGESMGGAVGIDLASRFPDAVSALILGNTWLSLPKVISTLFPRMGSLFSFMVSDVWNSEQSLNLIPSTMPILFLAGVRDELVPHAHMKKLYEIACNGDAADKERRVWWELSWGHHNDTFEDRGYWEAVEQFIERWADP